MENYAINEKHELLAEPFVSTTGDLPHPMLPELQLIKRLQVEPKCMEAFGDEILMDGLGGAGESRLGQEQAAFELGSCPIFNGRAAHMCDWCVVINYN